MPLDPILLEAISKHIGLEAANSLGYLTASSWLNANSWPGFSKYFGDESVDELSHARAFTEYCARFNDFIKVIPSIIEFPTESPEGIFRASADIEKETEDSMRQLVVVAESIGDADAVEFISGRLNGQSAMTKEANDLAVIVERSAGSVGSLVLLDRHFSK